MIKIRIFSCGSCSRRGRLCIASFRISPCISMQKKMQRGSTRRQDRHTATLITYEKWLKIGSAIRIDRRRKKRGEKERGRDGGRLLPRDYPALFHRQGLTQNGNKVREMFLFKPLPYQWPEIVMHAFPIQNTNCYSSVPSVGTRNQSFILIGG